MDAGTGVKETILVIDHDERVRKALAGILGRKGYAVREGSRGEDALSLVRKSRPDLVLLEFCAPRIEAFEVCRAIKRDPLVGNTPVIFLSERSESEDKVRGFESGGADYVTKPFDEREVIARVENQLRVRRLTGDLVRANRELTEKQRRLDEDLRAAGGIQQSLLPRVAPEIRNLKIAWRFIPSYLIGGDIFNVFYLDENHAGFYMADVSGHGVPSALVAVSLSQMLQPQAGDTTKKRTSSPPWYEIVSPGSVLRALDAEYPMERFDMYFTIVYLIIDLSLGRLVYSNAAHPYPVIVRRDGEIVVLDKGGTIIGMGGEVPFEEEEVALHEGDRLVVYTDGLVEVENGHGELFGEERLYDHLRENRGRDGDALLDGIIAAAREWSGTGEFGDDLTLAVLELDKGGVLAGRK